MRLVEAVCGVAGGGIGSGRLDVDGVADGVAGLLDDVPGGTDVLPGGEMFSERGLVEAFGNLPGFVLEQAAAIIELATAKATRKCTAVPEAALFAGLTAVPVFLYELLI
jgi:hypothetical protein